MNDTLDTSIVWPEDLLKSIGPTVFQNGTTLKPLFEGFLKSRKRVQWASELASISGLLNIRDYVEDTLNTMCHQFKVTGTEGPSLDILQSSLKRTIEATERRTIALAYLEEHALSLRQKITVDAAPTDFVAYAIQQELATFFSHADTMIRFRPLLKASKDLVDTTIQQIESLGPSLTFANVQAFARDLGLKTVWPILAMVVSIQNDTSDRYFLNTPMPRVFGAPSCVRNSLNRRVDPHKLVRASRTPLRMSQSVLAGPGHIAYKPGPDQPFEIWPLKHAGLIAAIPGVPNGRYIWALDTKTFEGGLYRLGKSGPSLMVEFEVPRDETDVEPNWIDCQRDQEGSLVLLWGHISPQTGNINTQNVMIFDDTVFTSGKDITFLTEMHAMPNRRSEGTRIDWRDHGNLVSVHHTVQEDQKSDGPEASLRSWQHTYEIVFGDFLLMTITTDARPIESVFGSPTEMILLSPMSSKNALQLWSLRPNDTAYDMTHSMEIPKCPKHYWTSLTVI